MASFYGSSIDKVAQGISLPSSTLDPQIALRREAAKYQRNKISPYWDLDPEVDYVWGALAPGQKPDSTYFDYFYTGQDVKVYIEGANDDDSSTSFACSPFMEMGYSIQQEKMPIYGAWSYSWDAVARGTRVVSGVFRMATTYPNRLVDMITAAANTRADKAGMGNGALRPIRDLNEDEANIKKFWGKNLEKSGGEKRLFSVHPPFNFVIEYGMQPTSPIPWFKSLKTLARDSAYQSDPGLYYDTNERLVRADVDQKMSIVLEWVELTGCQQQFSPDGEVCSETYSFIAKDEIRPGSV